MSTSDNLVQINGFWVDLTTVESTLIIALSSFSLISVKLVSSSSRLALFFTALSNVDQLAFLKAARDTLLTCPSFPEPLAAMISFAKQLTEMPVDDDGDVDVSALRSIAEQRWEASRSSRRSRPVLESAKFGPVPTALLSPPSARQPGTARITSMPPMSISAFHSSTFPPPPRRLFLSSVRHHTHSPSSRPSILHHRDFHQVQSRTRDRFPRHHPLVLARFFFSSHLPSLEARWSQLCCHRPALLLASGEV
ncbi:hypothetical protein BJ322DRAFT_226334 [Thelephora terrestris]|uniref:Uncharacterized protein n=1 Tax=Thelephora terrestris TaxID=56493 RepID=A0A9P6L4Y6_9AGAM|nr:hypothetical protein BJ322DRAFT_226334 [Thelephora terrestris]